MQLNHAQRELTVKIVYYGPGLSGKTTNLQMIHARTGSEGRGKLLTVETHDDRTLFFDLLPVFFHTKGGFKVKVKLFTVPGQVIHNATRRVVLQNADAVAFIADSRRSAGQENNEYWENLQENMRENGLDPAQVPVVIQFNKRDLPDTQDRRRDRGDARQGQGAGRRGGGHPRRGRARDALRGAPGRLPRDRRAGGAEQEHRPDRGRVPQAHLRAHGPERHPGRPTGWPRRRGPR